MEGEGTAFERFDVGQRPLLGDEPLDLGDLLNTVLDKGAAVHGEVTIAVADVDLVRLNIGLLLQAIATAERRTGAQAQVRGNAGTSLPARVVGESLAARMGAIPHASPEDADAPLLANRTVRPGAEGATVASDPEPRDLNTVARGLPERINADVSGPESGLARLVLTLIEVLRKVLEHQAVRRMEGGRLSEVEIERLGLALAKLDERMGELSRVFGLTQEDLQIDLGPIGRLK